MRRHVLKAVVRFHFLDYFEAVYARHLQIEQYDSRQTARLRGMKADDIEHMVGKAEPSPAESLAGAGVLKPLPKPAPMRLIVLWCALVGGTLLLAAMAFSLLKRVRKTQ